MRRRAPTTAAVAVALAAATPGARAAAQVAPDAPWRTIETEHFRVHVARGLEPLGRRAAADAEVAYARLAAELRPPRGPIDIVVSDDVDYTNGYATPIPTNRIVVYARPPVDEPTLRYYSSWSSLVVTHELTHLFHLDRTRGIWAVAQRIFGRNPALFPNEYGPSWLAEGLAVYYESRITGYGRIAGSAHRAFARSAAGERRLPGLDELSLGTPTFPGGNAAYAYGSLLVDYLARTRGDSTVPRFVERESARFPLLFLDPIARGSFGRSFSGAFRDLRDSLAREALGAPAAGGRDLTGPAYAAGAPRWAGPDTLRAVLNLGRETEALYEITAGGLRRGGRRSGEGPNVRLPDGSLVFAQLEYTGRYTVRSDLWTERGGRARRLTRGARLSAPDARRADGALVAVQTVPGTTGVVRVGADGRVTPLTTFAPDTQWAEPRWSPDGAKLAAVRITARASQIVVLDTLGAVLAVPVSGRRVVSAPAWAPGGGALYFTSDRGGVSDAYVVTPGAPQPARLTRSVAGVFGAEPSPFDSSLAYVRLGARGFRVAVASTRAATRPADDEGADSLSEIGCGARARGCAVASGAPLASAPARAYRPWRTLVPRYWSPTLGTTGAGTRSLGAYTGASDPVGRHSYVASAAVAPARAREPELALQYAYAGLGQPTLGLYAAQSWEYPGIFTATGRVGRLVERERVLRLGATVARPRFRTFSYATASVGAERDRFGAEPDSIFGRLRRAAFYASAPTYTSAALAGGWSNVQRPSLSVSPEDGVSASGRVIERFVRAAGTASPSTELAADLRGYRALDLPGFAHHVLAARVAAGARDRRATGTFAAGGTSGSAIEVVPGYSLGSAGREFGARGFPAGAQAGTRAAAASAEYRLPLALPARGVGLLPVFLSKVSLAAFGDAASAWCPRGAQACGASPLPRRVMGSVGAELDLDAGVGYDQLYRARLGVAAPVAARDLAGSTRPASAYFTIGLAY